MSEPNEELLLIQESVKREEVDLFYKIAPLYGLDPSLRSPWNTRTVYPSQRRYEVPPEILDIVGVNEGDRRALPHTPIFEVMGLPDCGKSTLCKYLQGVYPYAVIEDEFSNSINISQHSDIDTHNLFLLVEKQLSILPSIQEQLRNKREQLHGNLQIADPAVFTRGPNDILAFSIPFYLSSLEDDEIFEPVSSFYIQELIHQLSFIDAVILFDNDLDTASIRRVRNGKDRYGKIVNPSVWPIIERGYSWWLQYVFPILRERYGTGLLILNGRDHYKKNNLIVQKYMKRVLRSLPST